MSKSPDVVVASAHEFWFSTALKCLCVNQTPPKKRVSSLEQTFPGTASFKTGGRSFPKSMGTLPIPAHDRDAGRLEEVARLTSSRVGTDKDATLQGVRRAITAIAKECVQERLRSNEEAKNMIEICRDHTNAAKTAEALNFSRTLRELGTWQSVRLAEEEHLGLLLSARDSCGQHSVAANIAEYSRSWAKMHTGIKKAPAVRLRGHTESKCHIAGTCHCRRGHRGVLLSAMWQKAQVALKQFFTKGNVEELVNCLIVFLWVSDVKGELQYRMTSVPVHYLRPWRPTFLEMLPARVGDGELLEKVCAKLLEGTVSEEDDDTFVSLSVRVRDDVPAFFTPHQFMQTLDATRPWRVGVLQLSTREVPFLNSNGLVSAKLFSFDLLLWWTGVLKPEFLADPDDADSEPEMTEAVATETMEHRTAQEEEMNDAEEEEGLSDVDVDAVAVMMEMEEARPGSPSSKASSSASEEKNSKLGSEGALSSGEESGPEKKEDDQTELVKLEVSGLPAEKDGDKKAHPTTGVKRDRSHVERYGPHHLVKRFKSGICVGYQLSCRVPGHAAGCSKEMAFTVGGTEQGTRRLLKTWALMGHGIRSKQSHMANSLRLDLLDASKSGQLLTEDELDKLVDEEELPQLLAFPTQPTLSTQESILGERAPDVSPQFHQEMSELAAAGRVPVTSLAMRTRNRQAANTDYLVPRELLPALRHGYISPNFQAPQGMQWLCAKGQWRLAPRGG